MKIEVSGLDDMNAVDQANIENAIMRTLEAADLKEYSVSVSLVDTETMIDLNHRFKNKNYVTDVLSFPTPDMEKIFAHTKFMLGDVVICLEQARVQAEECGHTLVEEIAVLASHGLFHLLGYDHEVSEDEALIQMQGEMFLLEKAGFSPELSLIGRM